MQQAMTAETHTAGKGRGADIAAFASLGRQKTVTLSKEDAIHSGAEREMRLRRSDVRGCLHEEGSHDRLDPGRRL
jgi:hypothetical protein